MARHSLIPMGSGDAFMSLQRGMNRLFDDVFGNAMPTLRGHGEDGGMVMPQMNVSETESEMRITAEIPGVADKDVDVTLDGDMLTIRGEKKAESKEDKENYHFVERSFGQFQRSLRIPYAVNPDQVKASVDKGILTVILPKNMAQEKTRHIQVRSGAH